MHEQYNFDTPPPFVGRDELAKRLGLHTRTISRMVERGELPRPCMGRAGRPRWLWAFVLEFCHDQHTKQSQSEQAVETVKFSELSVRVGNALRRGFISTLPELRKLYAEGRVASFPGLGETSVCEVADYLQRH